MSCFSKSARACADGSLTENREERKPFFFLPPFSGVSDSAIDEGARDVRRESEPPKDVEGGYLGEEQMWDWLAVVMMAGTCGWDELLLANSAEGTSYKL